MQRPQLALSGPAMGHGSTSRRRSGLGGHAMLLLQGPSQLYEARLPRDGRRELGTGFIAGLGRRDSAGRAVIS